MNQYWDWALSNSAPTCTHPHSLPHTPHTQNIFPPTPTHPYFSTLTTSHTKHGPITHIYSNFSWSSNSYLLKLLKLMWGHHIIKVNCSFHGHRRVWEFGKLRAICVVCQTCANFTFLCANMLIIMPACQRCSIYSTWHASFSTMSAKRHTNFSIIFKKNFLIMLGICKFQEYFANSRKLISWNKELNFNICKILLRKNLVNLKPLMSFLMEHVELTKQLFG